MYGTAFPSLRYSPATDLISGVSRRAFIKVWLGHSRFGSVLVPGQVFLGGKSDSFLQPSFFGPPSLAFLQDGLHVADFSIDVASPRGTNAGRVMVRIEAKDRLFVYPDGAQLYECTLTASLPLDRLAAGHARRNHDGDFVVELFHHTDEKGFNGILHSGEIWSGPWNLQGTRKLENVAHVYLTSLSHISDDSDLARIAMSEAGKLHFQTTSDYPIEKIVGMDVYRENTRGRTHAIPVSVETKHLAPPHMFFHPMAKGQPAYYEIVGPEIYRVPVEPATHLRVRRKRLLPVPEKIMMFNYSVLGEASTLEGLAAPYDEENTDAVMVLEQLSADTNFFEFWQQNANTNQVIGRVSKYRVLE